jgi:nucleotidyltransferase/DNA polymerase involved in DNA repair
VPVVCALVPAFKIEVARFVQPELRERPLIVVDRLERGHALAVDAAAFELGARAGMTLVQAGACAREAVHVVDDPARGAALWEEILEALDAASPLVEDAEPGIAYLEMRGIEGTPRAWLASVRAALAAVPAGALPFRLGLAANKFVARAAATVNDGTIVRSGRERDFVAPLPLHVLALEAYVTERLHLLGVRTLGELAALPHGPFVRRFGPDAAPAHDRANGIDAEPLVPRARALRVERSLFGEGTAEREEQVLFALRALVARVADDVAFAGKRCGYLRLTLECEDGATHEVPTLLAQPTAQAATMFDLLRTRLEGIVLAAPVCGLRLGAERLEEGGTERSLFAGSDPDPETVAVALARIEAALGPGSALRARVTAGHRYETRYAYETFDARGLVRRAPHADAAQSTSPEATLAYRVFAPREIAVRLERGRPVSVAGRKVEEIAGPWRVDESWWAQALDEGAVPYASDAYDVSLEDGTLWRIVAEAGRWYVRGAYD